MSMKHLVLPVAVALTLSLASNAFAIAWGEPDINNEYPNVASVRGLVEATNTARISCSGSLLHNDADKVVILTAAHCTDGWIAALADGMIDTVGVSFEQNNVIGGSFSDGTYYVRGGVPISLPAKDAPFEKLDYGLVVFPTSAVNHLGQTIQARWGTLTPVQVAPGADYLQSLIAVSGTARP